MASRVPEVAAFWAPQFIAGLHVRFLTWDLAPGEDPLRLSAAGGPGRFVFLGSVSSPPGLFPLLGLGSTLIQCDLFLTSFYLQRP